MKAKTEKQICYSIPTKAKKTYRDIAKEVPSSRYAWQKRDLKEKEPSENVVDGDPLPKATDQEENQDDESEQQKAPNSKE